MQWGVRGIWAALAIVSTTQGCATLLVVLNMDWKREAQRASALVVSYSEQNLSSDVQPISADEDGSEPDTMEPLLLAVPVT
jgi:hypothetical protein